jgi:hypothetical protein
MDNQTRHTSKFYGSPDFEVPKQSLGSSRKPLTSLNENLISKRLSPGLREFTETVLGGKGVFKAKPNGTWLHSEALMGSDVSKRSEITKKPSVSNNTHLIEPGRTWAPDQVKISAETEDPGTKSQRSGIYGKQLTSSDFNVAAREVQSGFKFFQRELNIIDLFHSQKLADICDIIHDFSGIMDRSRNPSNASPNDTLSEPYHCTQRDFRSRTISPSIRAMDDSFHKLSRHWRPVDIPVREFTPNRTITR